MLVEKNFACNNCLAALVSDNATMQCDIAYNLVSRHVTVDKLSPIQYTKSVILALIIKMCNLRYWIIVNESHVLI